MKKIQLLSIASYVAIVVACNTSTKRTETSEEANTKTTDTIEGTTVQTAIGEVLIPNPYTSTVSTKINQVVAWGDAKPQAPEGFTVTKYATDFNNPRWTYVAPNGDLFVSQASSNSKSANSIVVLRDTNYDGDVELRETFLENLNRPFGMLIIGNTFYVANTDGLYKYPYKEGQTKMTAKGTKIVDLPAGGYNNHWTRNLVTNKTQDKIFISVGSASNVAEHGIQEEKRRANILVVDLNGGNEKVYAAGLRNPVGMDWNPVTGELWTAVNERDNLGDNLVPDYITSVKEDAFYGWPYSYYGQIIDSRVDSIQKDLVAKALVPDVPMGAHTASLGLTFYTGDAFPAKYKNGAFVGQHGSWNRSKFAGYRVAFVPFENGKPTAGPQDFLTGFVVDQEGADVYGRPVCVTELPTGELLVNDDAGNTLWKVSYSAAK